MHCSRTHFHLFLLLSKPKEARYIMTQKKYSNRLIQHSTSNLNEIIVNQETNSRACCSRSDAMHRSKEEREREREMCRLRYIGLVNELNMIQEDDENHATFLCISGARKTKR